MHVERLKVVVFVVVGLGVVVQAAHCREIIIETASTRGDRPKLRATLDNTLDKLQHGDTLVIYTPDRIARSVKELLMLLEDQLHARGINLHILTGICAGVHRPNGRPSPTRCCPGRGDGR